MNNYPYQKLLFFIVLVITILYWGTAKSEVYEPKNHAFDCLAQNIYFEARSESQAGMIAVAQVTMNRVKHPRYPNTVCEVVKQGSYIHMGRAFYLSETNVNSVGFVMVSQIRYENQRFGRKQKWLQELYWR